MSHTVRSTILNIARLISFVYLSLNLNLKFKYQIKDQCGQ